MFLLRRHRVTNICFGGSEMIQVDLPMKNVAELVQDRLANSLFIKLVSPDDELAFNPHQVKYLREFSRPRFSLRRVSLPDLNFKTVDSVATCRVRSAPGFATVQR
jgi:hypothetical protein